MIGRVMLWMRSAISQFLMKSRPRASRQSIGVDLMIGPAGRFGRRSCEGRSVVVSIPCDLRNKSTFKACKSDRKAIKSCRLRPRRSTDQPGGKAMFQMMGVFAEFERSIVQERVRAGLSRAK